MIHRVIIVVSLILLLFNSGFAGPRTNAVKADTRMEWWRDARFGMFIHWGLYSVPAGEWFGKTGYGEWIRTSAQIPLDTYDRFRTQFNPVQFDADAWVRTARDAGMKYIVITSKHHDGFCMFDTKQTDFNIMNTPFHRDPMKELSEACKKYGLKFCFYYSIMDWHHPDYLPRRDWETTRSSKGADFRRYVDYMKAQLKELLTNYGEIGVLWFDGEWESTWNQDFGKEIYAYCRSLQPSIIINNRVGAGRLDMEGLTKEGALGGDFGTPEQQIPATGLPGVDWETCMTMNDHWGYNSHDKNFKSSKELIRMLADIASKGGNYLLNVGPTAHGVIPLESVDRLKQIGRWMKTNGESIWGTQSSPAVSAGWGITSAKEGWGRCTRKEHSDGTILFLHVFNRPADGKIEISGCLNIPERAYALSDPDRKELKIKREDDALVITLPETLPDQANSVFVLTLKGRPDFTDPPGFRSDFDEFVNPLRTELFSDRENVGIRYTLDGSEPSASSPLYTSPLVFSRTTTLSARCFRDEKAVSGTSRKVFRKADPLPAAGVAGVKPGIAYEYYEGEWDSLPDFSALKTVKKGILEDFVFSPRNQEERFGFVYTGYILIPETEVYAFCTGSDDGSCLLIDDRMIVDNDFLHGMQEKEGTVALEKGYHRIRVEFFEKTGSDDLKVYYRTGSSGRQPVAPSMLFH